MPSRDMPADASPPPPRSQLPLWLRYVVSAAVAVALVVALVVYVNGHNTDSPPSSNPAAAVQANREAEILVAQDQAPHVVKAPSRLRPGAALVRVLRADMRRRILQGQIDGPVQRAACRSAGGAARTAHAFSCTVEAGHVTYPFLGVVDQPARRITYCKRDPPPAPSDNVPVSRLCRA
jgi:hypothetical protein